MEGIAVPKREYCRFDGDDSTSKELRSRLPSKVPIGE